MTRQENADLLVARVSVLIKKKIIAWVAKKISFLMWGPFGPLVSYFAGQLAEYIAKDAEMRAFFLYTDLRTDAQGRECLKALIAYNGAVNKGEDQDEIKSREIELDNAFLDLVVLSR